MFTAHLLFACGGNDVALDKSSSYHFNVREFFRGNQVGLMIVRDRNANIRESIDIKRTCKIHEDLSRGGCVDTMKYHYTQKNKVSHLQWKQSRISDDDQVFMISDSQGDYSMKVVGRAALAKAKRALLDDPKNHAQCQIKFTRLATVPFIVVETQRCYAWGIYIGEVMVVWKH